MQDYQQEKKVINNSEINDENNDIEKIETKKEEKENNVPMFGEELDIPTYLRNKNS